MKENVIKDKSYKFAIRIVNLYKYLVEQKKEYVLSRQLLRSGTSIGSNVCEGEDAQSRADFLSKINISLKEAKETKYWLELIRETEYITNEQFDSIYNDCIEIVKILTSIVKSLKSPE